MIEVEGTIIRFGDSQGKSRSNSKIDFDSPELVKISGSGEGRSSEIHDTATQKRKPLVSMES